MLHRLTCFVVIFSILRSAYCADEDSRISIAVTGGGYTGVLTSIFLSGLKDKDGAPICNVHLFERNLNLMNGASTLCARRHYGGEYPTDRNTAEQCLFSSLLYQQMFPTEAILTGRRRNDFLVAKESTTTADPDKHLSLDQVHQHYAHLLDLYRTIFAQFSGSLGDEEAARQLFGRPEDFVEFLASPGDIGDERLQAHFAGGVSTRERGFQPFALGVILERLLAQNNVKVHLGCTVENAESVADRGYRLHYSSHGKRTQEFFADYVIGAAWHENPYLNIVAASRGAHPVQGNLATKVYLRSIGLFDVSGCANIPEDRSYFGLKGSPGGMVSFYSSAVAAIYIPEEELSLHGGSELTYDQARKTFLSREAQAHLDDLNGPTALQSEVLNRILANAQAKYPFLKGANPITLLTRTTVSVDPRVEQRSHVKPIWPLGERMRWLEAESTKATFSPVTALQVLSEIIRQPDVSEKISLSEDAKAFLAALYQLNFLDETGRPRENLLRLPEEFMLFAGDLTEDSDLAEMQLYALKRRLPFAMMEPFSRRDMVTIRPDLQIPMINWNVLDDVDLRSISPTTNYLRALADAVNALPPHKGFKSFRFKYYGEEMATSLKHAQAGLRLLEALGGDDSSEIRRPIGELEIDQLHLTLEGEAKALLDVIINSALKKLILTRFSTEVSLRDSFILSFDLARSLKSTRILFHEKLDYETVSVLLVSFPDAPELGDFMFSNNRLGTVLRGYREDIKFTRLSNFIERSKKLTTLDLSDNELFSGPEDQHKHGIFDAIKDRPTLHVDMGGNGLDPAEETSRKHFLFLKIKEMHEKKSGVLEKIADESAKASKKMEVAEIKWESIRSEYETLPVKTVEIQREFERVQNRRRVIYKEINEAKTVQKTIEGIDTETLVSSLRILRLDRELSHIDSNLKVLLQNLEKWEKDFGSLERSVIYFETGWFKDIRAQLSEIRELGVEEVERRQVEKVRKEKEEERIKFEERERKKRVEREELETLKKELEELDSTSSRSARLHREELQSKIRKLERSIDDDYRIPRIGSIECGAIMGSMNNSYGGMHYGAAIGAVGRSWNVGSIASSLIGSAASVFNGWTSSKSDEQVTSASTKPVAEVKKEVKVDPFSESLGKVREWVRSSSENKVSTLYLAYDLDMADREHIERLYDDLVSSGLFDHVLRDERGANRLAVLDADKVLVVGSRKFKERYESRKLKRTDIGVVTSEMDAVRIRLFERGDAGIIPVIIDDHRWSTSYHYSKHFFPEVLKIRQTQPNHYAFFTLDDRKYRESFFEILERIYNPSSKYNHPISDIKERFRRAIGKY